MYSNTIRKLMDAESMRLNILTQNRQKLIWKQESYRSVIDSLKAFQSNVLSVTNIPGGIGFFVTGYNELIDALNAEYRAQRPMTDKRSYYEPLTDAQRKTMSEAEISDWERNARAGLNYNDSIIGGIASQLRDMLCRPVILGDGTRISLCEAGITTPPKGEPERISLDEDRFNETLGESPGTITLAFTKPSGIPASDKARKNERLNDSGIIGRLNDIINWAVTAGGPLYEKAGVPGTGSALGNEMSRQIKAQDDKIYDLTQYLYKKENEYYNMFAKLEDAMTSATDQIGALQGLM